MRVITADCRVINHVDEYWSGNEVDFNYNPLLFIFLMETNQAVWRNINQDLIKVCWIFINA